jgi:type IV secretory pathway VirB2 component (pilin)
MKFLPVLLVCGFIGFNFANAAIEMGGQETEETSQNKEVQSRAQPQSRAPNTGISKKLNLAENNPIAALLCKVIRAFTGTIAKVLAVILIFGLGIMVLSATSVNPVSPVIVTSLLVGIGMLFSAEYLVGRITGDAGYGGSGKGKSCDCKHGISCEDA